MGTKLKMDQAKPCSEIVKVALSTAGCGYVEFSAAEVIQQERAYRRNNSKCAIAEMVKYQLRWSEDDRFHNGGVKVDSKGNFGHSQLVERAHKHCQDIDQCLE